MVTLFIHHDDKVQTLENKTHLSSVVLLNSTDVLFVRLFELKINRRYNEIDSFIYSVVYVMLGIPHTGAATRDGGQNYVRASGPCP